MQMLTNKPRWMYRVTDTNRVEPVQATYRDEKLWAVAGEAQLLEENEVIFSRIQDAYRKAIDHTLDHLQLLQQEVLGRWYRYQESTEEGH